MKKDLVNSRFSKLLVKSIHSKTRNGHIRYVCLCDCGNICNILGTHLLQGNTKSCGCQRIRSGKNHHQWSGHGEISGNFWDHIQRGANGSKGRRVLEFSITIEYIWNLFLSQNRKCALSGLDLKFPTTGKDRSANASLDRINSDKGYIPGNVQWVHKDVNKMKNSFSTEYFLELCRKIARV